ncbi:MAG: insulinase family protein [Ignavibacteriales bacterium]|nr:insulinase family protein [Ignavibacteriales bacterium]
MKRILFILTVLFTLSAAVQAQKQLPPEGGTPKDFVLPKKTTITLKNGIEAILVPYGTMPKVTVSVIVRAGNINEKENQTWLIDLTGNLMKEGTTSRSAEQIAEEASSMGGTVNIFTSVDQTTIGGDVLSEFGPKMVALLADVACNPLFPESELPRLKNDMVRQLTVAKSSPQQLTFEQFRKTIYGNHPYGRVFPTEEMVKNYSITDVKKFYADNFGAARTRIYVAGKFDVKEMEKAIRASFESWKKGPAPFVNIPKTKAKKSFHLVERPGAPQSTIYLGLPTTINPTSKEYVKMVVTNTLLGGYFSSRVTSNIREQKGYTYSPSSQISSRYHDTYYVQTADVTTDVTGAALKEILYEINRLQDEPPSTDELKAVQNYMAGTFVLQNSSRQGIIGQLAFTRLQGIGDEYLTNYVKNVHAVTPADVQQMAKTQLRDEDMTLIITGDKTKVEKQIEEYTKSVQIEKKK